MYKDGVAVGTYVAFPAEYPPERLEANAGAVPRLALLLEADAAAAPADPVMELATEAKTAAAEEASAEEGVLVCAA